MKEGRRGDGVVSLIVGIAEDEIYGGERSAVAMLSRLEHRRPYVITNRRAVGDLLREAGLEHELVDLRSLGLSFRAGPVEAARKLGRLVGDWRRLRAAFGRAGAPLVHLNDISPAGQLGLPAAKLAGLPAIVHVRSEVEPLRAVHRWILASAALSITVSRNVLERHLAALGGGRTAARIRGRSVALPNGVDLELVSPPTEEERAAARTELGVGVGDVLVLSLGSYEERKRQLDVLERVVPRVLAEAPRTQFVFAGGTKSRDEDYAARCRAAAETLDASRVSLLGYRPDVRALYAAADVVLLASSLEGLPRTVLEALAHARPVVSTATPGAAEILDGTDAGTLVPLDDDGSGLAAAIVDLASRPEEARLEAGRRGRALIERDYDVRRVARRFEELCERVLAP